MQREFIEGDRIKHQKPFSMFFICATIAGLFRYWVFSLLIRYYNIGEIAEADFFHSYLVIVHIVLAPIYTLVIWSLFFRSKYNYAEIGVLLLYTMSVFFLIVSITSILRLIFPSLETDYVEVPIIVVYNAITFYNFFKGDKKWLVIVKSFIAVASIFLIANLCEDLVISITS